MVRWAFGAVLWLLLLAGAMRFDTWVYENVSGAVAERTGFKTWRYGRPPGGRATALTELLELFKRLGHAFATVLISVTMVVLAPWRWRQVLLLWLCVGLAALVGEGLLKPAVAKLRPDALLDAGVAEAVTAERGPGALVVHDGETRNRGYPVFRGAFAGYRGARALTLPSGHAALAFASFAALSCFFPRGRGWFLLLACGAAASRVLMGDHFLSDVIAGGGVGYLCARAVLASPWLRPLAPEAAGPAAARARDPAS